MHTLFSNILPVVMLPDGTNTAVAAGTTDTLTSNALDTQGFESVGLVVNFGTITATGTVTGKIQHSDDNVTYADVASSSQQATAAANTLGQLLWSVQKPTKRYYKVLLTRATANAVINSEVAYLANPFEAAVTLASTQLHKALNAPLSGTA